MSVLGSPQKVQRRKTRPGDLGRPAIDLATIPAAELAAYQRLRREQAQSGRSLVFEPGGGRIPALLRYPRRIALDCQGCGVDLGASSLDIYVHATPLDVAFRCPACNLAERCGAEVV